MDGIAASARRSPAQEAIPHARGSPVHRGSPIACRDRHCLRCPRLQGVIAIGTLRLNVVCPASWPPARASPVPRVGAVVAQEQCFARGYTRSLRAQRFTTARTTRRRGRQEGSRPEYQHPGPNPKTFPEALGQIDTGNAPTTRPVPGTTAVTGANSCRRLAAAACRRGCRCTPARQTQRQSPIPAR